VTLSVGYIYGYVLVEEQNQLKDVAVKCSGMKEVEALVVGKERVCAVLEEEVYHIVVTLLCGP